MKTLTQMLTTLRLYSSTSSGLPSPLFQAAVGQLLGDAHARKSSPTANTRLMWSFVTKFQEYAEFIALLFAPFCKTGVYSVQVLAKVEGILYNNYRLKTVTSSLFNTLFDMFYVLDPITNKYVKIVPIMIKELMTPIVLAHLIMGDGNYLAYQNLVRIYTNSFTYDDCSRLADAITHMGITTRVVLDRTSKRGIKQYILKIEASQLDRLRSMVLPHMHKSMFYRVGA